MKRKFLAIALVSAMAVSLAACGGSGSSADNTAADSAATTGGGSSSSSSDSLRLVNGKIEVDAPLKALAAAYEAETGVHVEIESMGGGVDIQGQLKQYYQGNNMPDIFVNGGATDFANWEGLLADMSSEKWVEDRPVNGCKLLELNIPFCIYQKNCNRRQDSFSFTIIRFHTD